jgi:prepilin-type N-terminal cleavage/methylation domain-containing protein
MTDRRSGFSLIEVLVAIGLMAILALGLAEIFRQQIFVQDKLRDRGSLEDMRNVVRSVVNCQLTCAENMARIPVNQGRWALEPSCDSRGLKVMISDSKATAPASKGSLFTVNDGYICLYLGEKTVDRISAGALDNRIPMTEEEMQRVLDQATKQMQETLDTIGSTPVSPE